jgi:hypothetical protein
MSFSEFLKVSFLKIFAHFKVLKYPFFFAWNPHTLDVKVDYYYAVRNTIQAGDILLHHNYSHATLYSGDKKLFMP